MADEEEEPVLFTGVRRVLQGLIGHTLIDITGADEEDPEAVVCLMFDDSSTLTIAAGDGPGIPFSLEGPAVEKSEDDD